MRYAPLFSGLGTLAVLGSAHWPAIRPGSQIQRITIPTDSATDAPFTMTIQGVSGKTLYRLECHGQNYGDETLIDFSGTFQCGLFVQVGTHALPDNLLAAHNRDEESTDWWNRGRMLSDQLLPHGPCDGFPEYGVVRHFRLRGMRITFQYADLVWSEQKPHAGSVLRQFAFTVTVAPDTGAKTAVAEEVRGPKPPRQCY